MQLRCFDANIHYSFDGLVIVKSNHKHQLSNPLIRLFSLLPTATIDQARSPSSLSLLEADISTAFPLPVSVHLPPEN